MTQYTTIKIQTFTVIICLQTSSELLRYGIGRDRFVTVSTYKGNLNVNVRVHKLDPQTKYWYPTKEGITLTSSRFASLCQEIAEIENQLSAIEGEDGADYSCHIGGGVFVTVEGLNPIVELRSYWRHKNNKQGIPRRTERGIALSLSEWEDLKKSIFDIRDKVPQFCGAKMCVDLSNHNAALCRECNPWDFEDNYQDGANKM